MSIPVEFRVTNPALEALSNRILKILTKETPGPVEGVMVLSVCLRYLEKQYDIHGTIIAEVDLREGKEPSDPQRDN